MLEAVPPTCKPVGFPAENFMTREKMLKKHNLIDYFYLKGESNNVISVCHGEISDSTWKRILRYTDL